MESPITDMKKCAAYGIYHIYQVRSFIKPNIYYHQSPVDSPHRGQWGGALMFSSICAWTIACISYRLFCSRQGWPYRTNGWAIIRGASDLRGHHTTYDVTVMTTLIVCHIYPRTTRSAISFATNTAWEIACISYRLFCIRQGRPYRVDSAMEISNYQYLGHISSSRPLQWRRMNEIMFQITGNSTICPKNCSGKENPKAPCYWPFARWIHRWFPLIKGQYHGKCFQVMTSLCRARHG